MRMDTDTIAAARALLTGAVELLAADTVDATGIGYRPAPMAPDTWDKLQAHHESARTGGVLLVFDGASDTSIYLTPQANYAFRYWHDMGHIEHGCSFTPEDETRLQLDHHIGAMGRAMSIVRPRSLARGVWTLARAMYRADTIGQIEYVVSKGKFPEDQLAFVLAYVEDPASAVLADY